MTLLPDLQQVSNGVLVTLDDGHQYHVVTATQARQLGDLLRKAEAYLEEQARERGTRLDRDAARLVNDLNAELHAEWPGGTLPQPFPPTVHRIVACSCDRHGRCADCSDGAA